MYRLIAFICHALVRREATLYQFFIELPQYIQTNTEDSCSYQDGYIAYRKHFLDFRENNNPILMNVNCGDIPTCPYKYYQEGGNNRDIYLHYYDYFDVPKKYSFTDFPFSNIENQNDLQIQDQDEEPF